MIPCKILSSSQRRDGLGSTWSSPRQRNLSSRHSHCLHLTRGEAILSILISYLAWIKCSEIESLRKNHWLPGATRVFSPHSFRHCNSYLLQSFIYNLPLFLHSGHKHLDSKHEHTTPLERDRADPVSLSCQDPFHSQSNTSLSPELNRNISVVCIKHIGLILLPTTSFSIPTSARQKY